MVIYFELAKFNTTKNINTLHHLCVYMSVCALVCEKQTDGNFCGCFLGERKTVVVVLLCVCVSLYRLQFN